MCQLKVIDILSYKENGIAIFGLLILYSALNGTPCILLDIFLYWKVYNMSIDILYVNVYIKSVFACMSNKSRVFGHGNFGGGGR